MTEKLDFEALGFKAGLEIHQQLSGAKLFCACPADIREDTPHFCVRRYLKASVGESGEIDVAAAQEQAKQKQFIYQGYQDTTCLVEIDEEPVSAPGPRSVETAVMVSELFGMQRVDQVHVMRKVVVDGSNTSGFQRTMFCSYNGAFTPEGFDTVRLDRLCLEEDSAKIVERTQTTDTYNLSRLGIPLLEITTKPDIKNPFHLQAAAAHIGMVLRSTGRVKRGLGTIRQDVNISIAGGTRVEIKGVQDLHTMPVLAENEVRRQQALIALHEENTSLQLGSPQTITNVLKPTKGWLVKTLKSEDAVAVKTSVASFLGKELYSGYRFGTELAGYCKAWGFGGIIHDAEKPEKYGLQNWDAVKKSLGCGETEGFIIAVGNEQKATALLQDLLQPRIDTLLSQVPSEVRKANEDGTTTYLRPMPGSARMYPETDVRPFRIDDITVELPELLNKRLSRVEKKTGIAQGVLSNLEKAGLLDAFEDAVKEFGKEYANLLQDMLYNLPKQFEDENLFAEPEQRVQFSSVFIKNVSDRIVSKASLEDVYKEFLKTGTVQWERYKAVDTDELRSIIKGVIATDPDAPMGALMGAAMKRLGGKADGKTVSQLLREELK